MSDCKDWEWTVGGFSCGDVGGKMLIGGLNNRMSHINNEHISMDNQTKSEYVDLDWKSHGTINGFPDMHNTSSHQKPHWTQIP